MNSLDEEGIDVKRLLIPNKDNYLKFQLSRDNVGLFNRPLILVRQIEANSPSASSGSKSGAQNVDHIFRLEFDESTRIPPCWVDTKTLNFFNTLRDNIFASSSYDKFEAPQQASSA